MMKRLKVVGFSVFGLLLSLFLSFFLSSSPGLTSSAPVDQASDYETLAQHTISVDWQKLPAESIVEDNSNVQTAQVDANPPATLPKFFFTYSIDKEDEYGNKYMKEIVDGGSTLEECLRHYHTAVSTYNAVGDDKKMTRPTECQKEETKPQPSGLGGRVNSN